MSARMRLGWFAAVVFVVLFGLGELAGWIGESLRGPSWWAIDFVTYDAARRVADGAALYADPKYLYPPLASLLGIPFLLVDRFSASLILAAVKILLAAYSVMWLTPGWTVGSRALAMVTLVTSLPFLHDLMLANTNVLLVAAMVPAMFGQSRPRNGVLLGLATAAFAKPLVIPVVLWLAIWRRGSFVGAAIAGAAGSVLAAVVLGPGSYADWVASVRAGSVWLSEPFIGNHGVTALSPALWAPIAAVTAIATLGVLAMRGPRVGLVWAAASGILLAPYAGTYGALPVVLALPAIGPLAPVLALVIVAISPIATTHPLPFYAAGIMLASLALRERGAAGTSVGLPVAAASAEALG
jgi:Glycosyltransferase family 87